MDGASKDIVVRKERRRSFSPPDYKGRYELLSPDSNGRVEVISMSLEPGTASPTKILYHAGDEHFELEVGDSIYLNEGIPHRVTSVGDEELVCIVAISPPSF